MSNTTLGIKLTYYSLSKSNPDEVSHFILKGYPRYKTITSQNVPSEAQIKNFFISEKKYAPFSRYSSFCVFNHPMIYQISDVTVSIST